MSFSELREEALREIDSFREEALLVYTSLVLPTWGKENHGVINALYGYMMRASSFIDLYSFYAYSKDIKNQSDRMRSFIVNYMKKDELSAALAIQLWRHCLMHTGRAYPILDERSGKHYEWLLHWSTNELPIDQHFRLCEHAPILGIALLPFLDDIKMGIDNYFQDLLSDPLKLDEFLKIKESIKCQSIKKLKSDPDSIILSF